MDEQTAQGDEVVWDVKDRTENRIFGSTVGCHDGEVLGMIEQTSYGRRAYSLIERPLTRAVIDDLAGGGKQVLARLAFHPWWRPWWRQANAEWPPLAFYFASLLYSCQPNEPKYSQTRSQPQPQHAATSAKESLQTFNRLLRAFCAEDVPRPQESTQKLAG